MQPQKRGVRGWEVSVRPGQASPGPEEQDGAQALTPSTQRLKLVGSQLVRDSLDHITPPGYSVNLEVSSTFNHKMPAS